MELKIWKDWPSWKFNLNSLKKKTHIELADGVAELVGGETGNESSLFACNNNNNNNNN